MDKLDRKEMLQLIRDIGAPSGLPLSLSEKLTNAICQRFGRPRLVELDEKKIAETLFDVDNPNPALMANRFCGHSLWVQPKYVQDKYKDLAKAICQKFGKLNCANCPKLQEAWDDNITHKDANITYRCRIGELEIENAELRREK